MEISAASMSSEHPDVGLLIVHGIGEQKIGETADKLVDGLSLVYGSRLRVTRDASGVPTQVSLGERTVRLYEVYWADILSVDRVQSTFRWNVIRALGWFPWFNWKGGLVRPPMYSRRKALIWTMILVPLTLALHAVYMGARLFANIFKKDTSPEVNVDGLSGLAKWRAIGEAYAEHSAHGRTVVEDLLDAFAGDVTNYVASLGRTGGERKEIGIDRAGEAILDCFYVKLAEAIDDGCREIQILSHSLGTVIAYHGLSGKFMKVGSRSEPPARTYDPVPKLSRLYSIGSPLEKIRFFWPTTIGESLVGPFAMENGHAVRADENGTRSRELRWDNFHHRFDMVSGRLRRFEHWGGVNNHALKGGGGLMRSHVVYERSPEFLTNITEGLFGEPASPEQSRSSRMRDKMLSGLENLAMPIGLGVLFAVGVLLYVLTALMPGFLLSIPFRLIGNFEWAHTVQNVVNVPFLIMMGILALWYPFMAKREARQIHRVWTQTKRHPYLEIAAAEETALESVEAGASSRSLV